MKKPARDGRKSGRRSGPQDILRQQAKAFEKKFGRGPGSSDPLFFDPDADEPQKLSTQKFDEGVLATMRDAGIPPQIIYAFKKTGMLLREDLIGSYPVDKVAEWESAIDEYFAMEARTEHSDATPQRDRLAIAETEIPALQSTPLDAEEKKTVLSCLRALDEHLEKQAITTRARIELAAVVLLMGAEAAFESAYADGSPEQDEMRYQVFVDLVVARARELFNS